MANVFSLGPDPRRLGRSLGQGEIDWFSMRAVLRLQGSGAHLPSDIRRLPVAERQLQPTSGPVNFTIVNPENDPKLLENPVFQRVLADSLSIQDRFSAEPVFARTGKGFLKSEGVRPLQEIKSKEKLAED
jgi:hypothetical protein